MPLLDATSPTLVDIANLPDAGEAGQIVNMLKQFNPILEDAPAFPCNNGHKHKTTVLTGLPTPVWGTLYQGIPASKGTRQPIEDVTARMEAASQVDQRLVDDVEKAEEKASLLLEEASGQIEAMAQEAATALIYHNSALDPKLPMGFAPRFGDLGAENGGQIIDGLGVGADNTSAWMITWDKMTNHLIFPKHLKAGIQRVNRGTIPVNDSNGDTYFAYREDYYWHLGLSVRDWRYVSRGANIDVSDLTTDASAGANLIEVLTEMYYKHYGRRVAKGKTCIYMNTTLVKFLDYQARNAVKNLFLTFKEAGPNQKEVLHFRDMPIREMDAILNTEAQVS